MDEISLLGRHCIVGLSEPRLTRSEAKLLSTLRPAGIILFRHNIDTASERGWGRDLLTLIANAREASEREKFIVSIDHEGGKVHRLPEPITRFTPCCSWQDLAEDVGRAMGEELASIGINLSFAPVLDILSNPENRVIGERAFATEAEEIWPRAEKFISGLENAGVIACGKHFPGHGRTFADSHFELPTVSVSLDELENCEFVPFRQAVDSGIKALMTAHVVYTALDPEYPATLSRKIINELLRSSFGFSGTVFTDALEMNALGQSTFESNSLTAMQAGADYLLYGMGKIDYPAATAQKSVIHILRMIDKSEALERAISQSAKRTKTFVEQLPDNRLSELDNPEEKKLHRQLAEELQQRYASQTAHE